MFGEGNDLTAEMWFKRFSTVNESLEKLSTSKLNPLTKEIREIARTF